MITKFVIQENKNLNNFQKEILILAITKGHDIYLSYSYEDVDGSEIIISIDESSAIANLEEVKDGQN